MGAIGIGLALGPRVTRTPLPQDTAQLRIVPNGAGSAFVIAPHGDLGAIAYELTFANGANEATPGSSIGAPFGGWRWTGTHHLAAVSSNPAEPLATLHEGTSSLDSARQADFGTSLFGGHHHGGIVISATDVPDLSSERYVSTFSFGYQGAITWPTGETANVTYEMAIQPDGNLAGMLSYTSSAAFSRASLSTMIADGFTHYSIDDGDTFNSCGDAGTYALGAAAGVRLLQSSTGYEISVQTSGQEALTGLTNDIESGGSRIRHDVRTTSAGGPLGTASLARTITFRKVVPTINLLSASDDQTNAAYTSAMLSPSPHPNGTRLAEDVSTGSHYIHQQVTAPGGKYTFSVEAKPAGRNWIILNAAPVGVGKYFDVMNGLLGSNYTGAPEKAGIINLGDGWYRCWITFTMAGVAGDLVRLWLANGDGGRYYAGNGSSGVITGKWQLEAGDKYTRYVERP